MFSGRRTLLLMAFPCAAALFVFSYLPLAGWAIAFFEYKPGLKLLDADFAGFKYFRIAFEDPEIWPVLRNTFAMGLLGLSVSPLAALFALFLSELSGRRLRNWIQTAAVMPNFISWVIVYAICYFMLSPSEGLVNRLLLGLGFLAQPIHPLADPDRVWLLQTALTVWKNLGLAALVYMAAIAGIDRAQYDAAAVDGAGRFRTMLHVTVPGVLPTFITLLLLQIGSLLNNGFEQYYLFNNGLVQSKIQVLDLYVYRIGILQNQFPLSAAIGIIQTGISLVLLMSANFLFGRLRNPSTP